VLPHPGSNRGDRVRAAARRSRSHSYDLPRPDQRLRREADVAMTTRPMRRLGVLLAAVVVSAVPANAHRLDELLQATRVDGRQDRIALDIDITPGAQIASKVCAEIDTDRDGVLNDEERRQYAQRVLSSNLVSIDGRVTPLALVALDFPAIEAMAAGTGT